MLTDDAHRPTWDVPGAGGRTQSDPSVRFRELSSTESERSLSQRKMHSRVYPRAWYPYLTSGHDRLSFWRPTGDADENICRVAILHPSCSPPLKSMEGGREVSLKLCAPKDDVTSQPGTWIRTEIGLKQGAVPELQHWSLLSCHVNVHENRTVRWLYSQT